MAAGRDDGNGGYDRMEYARGVVSRPATEGNSAGRAEKNPTATLRLVSDNMGSQWLMYGGLLGGRQDYQPPVAGSDAPGCDWFIFYYRGILYRPSDGREVFGFWKLTVRGKGLEPISYQIAKHTLPWLRAGDAEHRLQNLTVASIVIEPFEPVPQNPASLESEDDD